MGEISFEDIGKPDDPKDLFVNREELKAEAVKWVKERLREKATAGEIAFWGERFNLTEEDLKDKSSNLNTNCLEVQGE